MVMDKFHQGAAELLRAITLNKKPRNRCLSRGEEATNRNMASDHIIGENLFCWLCMLWSVIGSKWRWKEDRYDSVSRFSTPLTNVHIQFHPLRSEDGSHHRRFKKRLYAIGDESAIKRRRVQESFRQKRRRSIELQFRNVEFNDREIDST